MNILHLVNFAGSSGSEKYVRTLIMRQIADGHNCTLVYNIKGPLVDQCIDLGAYTTQLTMNSVLDIFSGIRLAAICRARGIEVIHTHFPRENCVAIIAKRFYPKISVINTSHLVFTTGFAWRVINRVFSPADKAVLCVCSEQLKTLKSNGVMPERLRVVHNGIPPVDVDALKNQYRDEIRKEFSLSSDDPVLITLARFTESKGLDVLIRAMALLHEKVPQAKLIIAGKGEDFDKVRSMILQYDLEETVLTPGFRDDSQALLAASDIYVNTSRSGEALSFAIIESMALGLVPVISDAGGNPDIVDKSSSWGYSFASEDYESLGKILIDLVSDPNRIKSIGEKAKNRADSEFSEDKMYWETMKAYV